MENSIPPSPQEPTEQGTENTAHSEPTKALPEARKPLGMQIYPFTLKI